MDGGYTEKIVVNVNELLPVSPGISLEEAAAVPLSLLTAWHMLVGRAHVEPGQTVLIQAIGSGVGTMALQIARMMNCRILGTASSEDKRARARSLGADAVFAYSDIRERTRELAPDGVDVVLDHVGSATWQESLRTLRWGGTFVTCGATSGHKVDLDLRLLFYKQLSLLGSTMGSMGEMLAAWQHFLLGRIRPVVYSVLPMTEAGSAHTLLEERDVFGKVVLRQDLGSWT